MSGRNGKAEGGDAEIALFVYGSFLDAQVFTLITGEAPHREDAVLPGYEKVTSLKTFPYVVAKEGAEVKGQVLSRLLPGSLSQLDHFECEGKLYRRGRVTVRTARGDVAAFVYEAGPELLAGEVSAEVELADRLSDFIQEKITEAIAADVPAPSRLRELHVRARAELLGGAIDELVREHFERGAIPPPAVKHRLEESGLPSLKWLAAEPYARTYAPHYLGLMTKAIVFNQVEARIYRDFRGAVRVRQPYYEHAVSAVAAFQFLADNLDPIAELAASLGMGDYNADLEYVDYAVAAIFIADELYDRGRVAPYVDRIRGRRAPGATPLGAEVEFSRLGRAAIGAAPDEDDTYDGFYYFDDFDLGRRLWKVGGHVDDHRVILGDRGRVRGFLEFSFGRYKVLGDLARPVTTDPVLLSDLANAAVAFAEIKPHSLHVSLALEPGRDLGPPPSWEHLICLLILGGDLNPDEGGVLRERRLHHREIYDDVAGLDFSRVNEYRATSGDAEPTRVISYQFPRLFYEHSYVDLIMALKGLQLATNAGPLDESPGAPYRRQCRESAEGLLGWADAPSALSAAAVRSFLEAVEQGMGHEAQAAGSHPRPFYDEWLAVIESKLTQYNEYLRKGGA